MKSTYKGLIPQNIAPQNATKIVVEKDNKKVCEMDLGPLKFPSNLGTKQYSFGAISDVHLGINTSQEDLANAISYFNSSDVSFVCVSGDITDGGTEWQFKDLWKNLYKPQSTKPIYEVAGNHDCYGEGLTDAKFEGYTGRKLFYTFTQGNDVFIMLSMYAWSVSTPFALSSLQSLYNTLEANRNKRCFVFQHIFPWGGAGDPFELYSSDYLTGTQGQVIYSLMSHYKNALWFHGHSHQMFQVQEQHEKANYDFDRGCHSIHIPSLASPIDIVNGQRVSIVEGSQGYVVDVYPNHIVLKGRDFSNDKDVPLAYYCLDTTLKTIAAGTYTDSTGTIVT